MADGGITDYVPLYILRGLEALHVEFGTKS